MGREGQGGAGRGREGQGGAGRGDGGGRWAGVAQAEGITHFMKLDYRVYRVKSFDSVNNQRFCL